MTSVGVSDLPEDRRLGMKDQLPAALIGRLAVDERCQGSGLGKLLLVDALRKIARAAETVAAAAVVQGAIDDDAKAFYVQYGFLALQDDPRHLFLPMATVRQLLEAG